MAKVLIGSELGSYTFNKTAKTITFSGFTASLERLLLITDSTNNTPLYQFNSPSLGASLSNNVLTLNYNTNTGAFADTDKLQIFYWSEEPQQTAMLDLAMSIKRDLAFLRRIENDAVIGKSVVLNGMTTGLTLAAVTNLTTLTNHSYWGTLSDQYIPQFVHLTMRDNFNTYKAKLIS